MKAWFDCTLSYYYEDERIQFCISAYRHAHKGWKGFTVNVCFFKWMFTFCCVDNYAEYDRVINRRYKK